MRTEIEVYQRPDRTGWWAIILLKNEETKTCQILKTDGEWEDCNGAIALMNHHYHKIERSNL